MLPKISSILAIMAILFTSSFVSYSYASVESEAMEDILAGCRDGQTLVYRSAYLDYVCVEPSTAKRWVELGLAEIVGESAEDDSVSSEVIEKNESLTESEFPGAPPPPPKPTVRDSSDDSECRDGNILVYRFAYQDTICTSHSTASTWERLGISEIVKKSMSVQDDESIEIFPDLSSENIVETTEIPDMGELETVVEEELETVVEEPTSVTDSENISESPQIHKIEEGIWAIVDNDNTSSVLIEGDKGIIVIGSLNSYTSTKQMMEEFKTISDKKIKSIVLTSINPQILFAINAYLEHGDGDVEIILNEELLEFYESDHDSIIENAIPFSPELTLNIDGIRIDLIVADGYMSDHTYVFLPDMEGVIIGDSNHGVFPIVLDLEYINELRD